MKNRYRIAALLLLAAAILACVPVLYSLHQARKQAIREKYVLLDDVSNSISRQVASTIDVIERLQAEMRSSGEPARGVSRPSPMAVSSTLPSGSKVLQTASGPLSAVCLMNT